ncbi:hypothetical protein C0995_001091 [Termitomyces sp. Mi166|nr:hypothetical protein C0995_001091 [Termitomyces sp. Mi166\
MSAFSATVNDALALCSNVAILEDCHGWGKQSSHDRALRALQKLGACLSLAEEICSNGPHSPTFDSTARNQPPELFYVNGSIPSWRVMMALDEKGIKFKCTRLLIMSDPKETRLPEFLKLDHRGKTPVLDVLLDPPTDPGTDMTKGQETGIDNELDYWETYAEKTGSRIVHFSLFWRSTGVVKQFQASRMPGRI